MKPELFEKSRVTMKILLPPPVGELPAEWKVTLNQIDLLACIERVLNFRRSFIWSYRLAPNRLNYRNIIVVKKAGIN